MNFKNPWPWLLLLTVINGLTALLTELYNDEAYYWAYSRFLDWGYFDHPPVIALFIKFGYGLIPNELGVRLLSVLSVSAALALAFKMAGTNDVKLFALLLFATFPFFLFGFTALPDSPMLLAVALFFYTYQRFLKEESWQWTLILALVMAFMLYTKYMGVVIILFTLASNMSLLKRKWFWIASILGAILFLPHLYWQYVNGFPTVQFHLVDRSAKAYDYSFSIEYVIGQILFYGPFMGGFMYWASLRTSAKDFFEKALKYSVGGTLVFFLVSSFKGRVEVNWTLGMLVPMFVLTLRFFDQQSASRKWLERVAWVSIPLLVLVRVHVIYPLVDFKRDRAKDFHGHKEFAASVLKEAKGLPIVAHRYQTASSLWFYTGHEVPVLNLNARFSQYDLWQFDSAFVNKPFAFVSKSFKNGTPLSDGLTLTQVDSFPGFKSVEVDIVMESGATALKVLKTRPDSFFAFLKRYPIKAQVDFSNQDGITIFSAEVVIASSQSVYPIDVPLNLVNSLKTAQVTLSNDTFGVIRRYPSKSIRY